MSGPAMARMPPSGSRVTQGTIGAIAEPQDQLGMHRNLAALAGNDAHDVGTAVAQRHEIGELDRALFGFERRFQDKRVTPVAPG